MTEEEQQEERGWSQGSEDHEQARWLAEDLEHAVRYDHSSGQWHVYNPDTSIWAPDGAAIVHNRIQELTRRRLEGVYKHPGLGKEEAKTLIKLYRRLFEVARTEGAMRALATRPDYKTDGSDWDKDPNLLGCANGVVDLRENRLLPPSPSYLVTMSTGHTFVPFEYMGEKSMRARVPVLWKFLYEVTSEDTELALFYLLWFGYSLFGVTPEQKFLILTGLGRNGKGALAHAMQHTFGQYNAKADANLYLRSKFGTAHSSAARVDLMELRNRRLAVMSEPEGGAFNEEMLKGHTGGDLIAARTLYSKVEVSWFPTHTLTFLTNQPPAISDIGPSMADRIMVADFQESYEGDKADKKLYGKLEAEAPAILSVLCWAAKLWYDMPKGLPIPKRIVDASAEYMRDVDPLNRALADAFAIERDAQAAGVVLYDAYRDWFERSGQDGSPLTQTSFGLTLARKGYRKERTSHGVVYHGIRPLSATELIDKEADRAGI